MLIDANVLLYSVDRSSTFHAANKDWLEQALNGTRRVGIPWQTLNAFLRIATNPRATREPLEPGPAFELVEAWLDAPTVWVPEPGDGHREILGRLLRDFDLRGALVSDASLAALCIEHGLSIVSADSDFARFPEVDWINPAAT
ncbi:MAG: PIN domain-containing protein [Actinobacteria bacterium ATB1]|nr:PIN domain-containing protein [Actinobacteria bacterium ATB1]